MLVIGCKVPLEVSPAGVYRTLSESDIWSGANFCTGDDIRVGY